MALSVTHAFTSPQADSGDITLVQPSNWNAAHTLSGTISGAQGGGMVWLGTRTASNSASLDFTSLITSTYDCYELEYYDFVPQTDDTAPWLRFSTDNGATFDSGNNYIYTLNAHTTGSTTFSGTNGGASTSRILIGQNHGNNTGEGGRGRLRFSNPNNTTLYKVVEGHSSAFYSAALGIGNLFMGVYKVATAVNAVQILMSSGNITSGKAVLYGMAKS